MLVERTLPAAPRTLRPIAVNSIERPGSRSVIRIFRSKVADMGPTACVTRTRELSASTTVTSSTPGTQRATRSMCSKNFHTVAGGAVDDERLLDLHPPAFRARVGERAPDRFRR